jgi:hypothetical protein
MGRYRKNWRDEVVPAYEEGGEAIGRTLMYHPEKEPELWKLMAGTEIWPRWYLKCFATLYRQAHPREYEALKKRWQYRRQSKAEKAGKSGVKPRTGSPRAEVLTAHPKQPTRKGTKGSH